MNDTELAELLAPSPHEMVWTAVPPSESDMTLLPDTWGPRAGCPHSACGAAWFYVEALGLEPPPPSATRMLGLEMTLQPELWVHQLAVPRATWVKARCARILCTNGHRTIVWDDGRLHPQPAWYGAVTAQILGIGAMLAGIRIAMGEL